MSLAATAAHLAACFALAAVLLGPWVRPLTAVIEQDLHGDTALLTWNLWHVTDSALHAENPYRTGSVYYPVGGNLTTHTYTPGFLPIGLLVRSLRAGEPTWPLAAYRATTWVSFALGLLAAFHALRALGAGTLAAAGRVGGVGICRGLPQPPLRDAPRLGRLPASAAHAGVGALRPAAATGPGPGPRSDRSRLRVLLRVLHSVPLAGPLGTRGLRHCWGDTRATLRSLTRTLGRGGVAGAASLFLLTAAPFLANWSVSHAEPFREDQAYFESANLAGFVVPDPAATPLYSSGLVAA